VIFGVTLGWFPFPGMVDVGRIGDDFGTNVYWAYFHAHTIEAIIDIARHLTMPALVLAAVGIAGDSRFMRGQLLEVLNQDYIRTARAKGLSPRVVTWKHALRNAIIPIVTNIGLTIPGLIGGAVVTERIFGWPGMGRLFIEAAGAFDYAVVIGIITIVAFLTLLFNLLTDLSYALVDPRIRYN
ncbi:MAG: ABC transporter permease, partial [Ktedonobacterales bacterium]|nr:ABC transporter permease [Ktedonobacterales bacterium]